MVHGDRKYVLQSYLYEMENAPNFTTKQGRSAPGMARDDFFHFQHKLIEDFLPRAVKAGSAYMLCEEGSNHLFRGYLIAEPFTNLPVVHFLKVKKGAQRQGAATALLERFYADFEYSRERHNCVYTHLTSDIFRKQWCQDFVKSWNGLYHPWLPYISAESGWDA